MASEQRDKLTEALAELRASHAALWRAILTIEQALQCTIEQGINALPQSTAPISEHRSKHRPGKPPKIDADPELKAFIAARIERLTFDQVASEVANHFPPSRQVKRSAIHAWWQNAGKAQSRNSPNRPG